MPEDILFDAPVIIPVKTSLTVRDNNVSFEFEFENEREAIPFTVDTQIIVGGGGPTYEGPYEVTPLAHDPVVLETKDHMMADDVTVHKVPKYVTSNLSGGKTVYIAEDSLNGN